MMNSNSNKHSKSNFSCDSIVLYLKEISEIPLLTLEEEKYYCKLAFEKDTFAQNILIESNLRLVISIARKYYSPSHFADLIQEGNLGLIRATQKFDYNLGCKFSTYVTYWINQSILKYLVYKKRLIYIPQHVHININNIKKFIFEYQHSYKISPTIDIISKSLNLSYNNIVLCILSEKDSYSFYDLFNKTNEYYFENYFFCNNFNPEFILEHKYFLYSINKLLTFLDSREKEILSKKYGLNQNEVQNYKQISHSLKLSPERIRQLHTSSLNKLRKIIDENPEFL